MTISFNQLMGRFNDELKEAKFNFLINLAQQFKEACKDPKLVIDLAKTAERFKSSGVMELGQYDGCPILVAIKPDYINLHPPKISYAYYYEGNYNETGPLPFARCVMPKILSVSSAQFNDGYEPVFNLLLPILKNHLKRTKLYKNKEAKSLAKAQAYLLKEQQQRT